MLASNKGFKNQTIKRHQFAKFANINDFSPNATKTPKKYSHIKGLFTTVGFPPLPTTACCSIQLADRDGDGSLVFPEFAMAMAMVAR